MIDDSISEFARQMFERIGKSCHSTVTEWNHDGDQIHVWFKTHPNTEMSKFLNAYKSASSRLIKRDFHHVKKQGRKETFWSRSYFLVPTGCATNDALKRYIEKQGEE